MSICSPRGASLVWLPNDPLRDHSPVETRIYALFQNTFALAAIVLILTRVVILLAQLQNEDFQTRTLIQPCRQDLIGNRFINMIVVRIFLKNLDVT